jgi:hypothetical protein
VLQGNVADHDELFGEASARRNDMIPESRIVRGVDNFVYVRVANRGGREAQAVTVRVYWALPSTLLVPYDTNAMTGSLTGWHLIGSQFIDAIPAGNRLTVFPSIHWPADAVPEVDHCCFIGLVGNAEDPAPEPAQLMEWDYFLHFVSRNNNVAWRNFNVVSPPMASSVKSHVLPFFIPGGWEKGSEMRLEVETNLPAAMKVDLEIPLALARDLKAMPQAKCDAKRQTISIPIRERGKVPLEGVVVPVNSHSPAKFLVNDPIGNHKNPHYLIVRQFYYQIEVGRITWRFTS